MGPASLHASLIEGGRELSSYPDRCVLKFERRTIPPETDATVREEIDALLMRLRKADGDFEATVTPMFSRPPYSLPADHALPQALHTALGSESVTGAAHFTGMSFWTDAAVLGERRDSVGAVRARRRRAPQHEEYVEIQDVLRCRDALAALARAW